MRSSDRFAHPGFGPDNGKKCNSLGIRNCKLLAGHDIPDCVDSLGHGLRIEVIRRVCPTIVIHP